MLAWYGIVVFNVPLTVQQFKSMDYSFLAARLSFTFIYTCTFFSWQTAAAAYLLTYNSSATQHRTKPNGT